MTHVEEYANAMSELYEFESTAYEDQARRYLLGEPAAAARHAYNLLLRSEATDDRCSARLLRTAGMALLAAVVEGDV
jgi:hypothetical protein